MSSKKNKESGFTLIELLVVIAIIGLLASIILASLNSARKKGRDARRSADLSQIRNALELYASDNNGNYPAYSSTLLTTDLAGLVPTYMSTLPKDPVGPDNTSTGYRYCTDANGYAILAHPERTGAYWCGLANGNNPCSWNQYTGSCQ